MATGPSLAKEQIRQIRKQIDDAGSMVEPEKFREERRLRGKGNPSLDKIQQINEGANLGGYDKDKEPSVHDEKLFDDYWSGELPSYSEFFQRINYQLGISICIYQPGCLGRYPQRDAGAYHFH